MRPLDAIRVADIKAAQKRIAGVAHRTPLLPLHTNAGTEIFLKLENLQPIGSFKIRGAANAMRLAGRQRLAQGVYTASAGNMAQGVAWNARQMDVPCTAVVPEKAPDTKLQAIRRLGGEILKIPFDDWWQVILDHSYPGLEGTFIHPVSDPAVMAGNGTIGLEILEDLPDVDTVIIPYGGGGLSCGIASAIRALKPDTRIFACEVETAAPLAASFAAGQPRQVDYRPSFVDGIGGKSALPEMYPLARRLLDDSLVMPLMDIAAAIRLLIERNRIIAEGAGACSVAAALSGRAGSGKIACVISGGNIDRTVLVSILQGKVPQNS